MKIKRNSIFFGLFISNIFMIFLVSSIMIFSVMSYIFSNLMNSEKDMAIQSLDQARLSMDSNLRNLRMLSTSVNMNQNVAGLLQNNSNSEQRNKDIQELFTVLRNNTSPAKLIIDSYVFRIDDRMVFSNNGIYNEEEFFKSVRNYKELNTEEYLRVLSNIKERTYLPLMQYESQGVVLGNVVTYLSPIYLDSSKPYGVFVAILDAKFMMNLMLPKEYRTGSDMFILNKENQVFLSTDPNIDIDNIKKSLTNSDQFFTHTVNNKRYLFTSLDSLVNDWSYVIMIPENIVIGKINNLLNMFLILIIVCIIISLSAAYFLSLRNYKPIKGIFDMVKALNKGHNSQNNFNVIRYDTIINTLRESFNEKTELENQMQIYTPIIKKNYIAKLITGRVQNDQEIKEIEALINMELTQSKFGVVVFFIDDCSEFITENNEEQHSMARLIISAISEETASRANKVFVMEEDNKIWMLLAYNPDKAEEECLNAAEKVVRDIFSIAEEKFKIVMSAGIGNIYSDFRKIRDSYLEADAALSHKFISGRSSITQYKNITVDNLEYYYPFEVEHQIIQNVKTGDYASANELITKIFKENFIQRQLPLKIARCVAFDIICTIFKILQQTNISYDNFLSNGQDISESLINSQSVNELFKAVSTIVEGVCIHINSLKEQSSRDLKEKITDYLNNYYHDKNLSLSSVADEFNLSNYYLSRIFKDLTGENFVDYLSKLRLKKAKELLKSEELLVSDIAGKVGYNSANTFIRAFKRYELITPMQFREGNQY